MRPHRPRAKVVCKQLPVTVAVDSVSGSNKVLKDGQVLFRAGDQSDGMYLVRRGELRVYLEQDGKEVQLASIGEGAMIGEMALFDSQPRSASVKATMETEITHISTDDFAKLMKQIPKWFVGLMTALSSRLRQTNERLKKLEGGAGAGPTASAKGKPFQHVIRQLNIFTLLLHRDGEKVGKEWVVQKDVTLKAFVDLFNEDPEKIKTLFDVLVKKRILLQRVDDYKNLVYAIANRAVLSQLTNCLAAAVKNNPKTPCLTEAGLAMLTVFEKAVMAAPYDSSTVSLTDLYKDAQRAGTNTENWETAIQSFKNLGEEVRLVKASHGFGLRASKKDITAFLRHHDVIAAIYKANLA